MRNITHIYRLNSLRQFQYNSHKIYYKKTILNNFNLKTKTYGMIAPHSKSTRVKSIFRSLGFQIALRGQPE